MKGALAFAVAAIGLLGVALGAGGCGSKSDSQYQPIGSQCSKSDRCGTAPFECILASAGQYHGGYCSKPCTTDGDCPADSLCLPQAGCRRRCSESSECRQSEGYACLSAPMGSYCDNAATVDDLGP